jgi:polar amino acid transport system substrate-binding protein
MSRRGFLASTNAAAVVAVTSYGAAQAAEQPTFDTSIPDFSLPKFSCDNSLSRLQEKNEIILCTSNDWPYAFVDTATGDFKGIEADIINRCARLLNISSIKVETVPFDGMIPGLLDGRFDMIGDSIHYTLKRAKVIEFSYPTYFYADGLVAKKGTFPGVKTLSDLKGKSCGALLGTNYAEEVQKASGVEFRGYKTWPEMAIDIQNGRLDCALHDQPIVGASIKDHPEWNLEMIETYVPFQKKTPAGYSVYGFRQEDVQLRAGFDAAIRWLQITGEMTKILVAWGLSEQNG